jgi:hypothetical protein
MKFKSIFEEIANKWNENESSYFLKQEDSKNFFKLELIGNKRTGYQIKDWISPASKKVEKLLQNWDGRTELKFDIPEFGSINDFHDLLNDNNVPDNLPEIGQMELFKSSKLTDFINGSFLEQYGLLINEKTKNLLIKFNLGKYKSYTFQVIYKDSANLDYYFLRNAASIDKFIDYKKK